MVIQHSLVPVLLFYCMYGHTALVPVLFVLPQLAPIRWMCRSRQKSLRQSTSMYKQGLPHHHLKVCAEIDDPSKIILQLFVLRMVLF